MRAKTGESGLRKFTPFQVARLTIAGSILGSALVGAAFDYFIGSSSGLGREVAGALGGGAAALVWVKLVHLV
jgi:hypothetical protein